MSMLLFYVAEWSLYQVQYCSSVDEVESGGDTSRTLYDSRTHYDVFGERTTTATGISSPASQSKGFAKEGVRARTLVTGSVVRDLE
jgi:hypothetical protein